jgi:hypothetical protein
MVASLYPDEICPIWLDVAGIFTTEDGDLGQKRLTHEFDYVRQSSR